MLDDFFVDDSLADLTYDSSEIAIQYDLIASFLQLVCDEKRVRQTFQDTFDQVTTLFNRPFENLNKTERTILGTKFEDLFRTNFDLPGSSLLDVCIDGYDVDIKFTIGENWAIPPECVNQWVILAKGDPIRDKLALGLLHASADRLTKGGNRDRKVGVSAYGRSQITWIIPEHTPFRSEV